MKADEFYEKWSKAFPKDLEPIFKIELALVLEEVRSKTIRECVNAEKKDDPEVKIDEVYFRLECLKLAQKTKTMSGIDLDPDRCIDVADVYFKYVKRGKV